MSTFGAVLAIAMIGFGNAFYIMALNLNQDGDSFTDGNFLMALIYSFRTGLGDFSTDGYDNVYASPWLWIIFLMCAILIQIILLNLLIAIMGYTYGKVTEIAEQSMLKEICSMISDNEFVLSRASVFKNSKYVVVARLEMGDSVNKSGNIEEKINELRSNFTRILDENKQSNITIVDQLKEDIFRTIEQKFTDNQSQQKK